MHMTPRVSVLVFLLAMVQGATTAQPIPASSGPAVGARVPNFSGEDARSFLADAGLDVDALTPHMKGRFTSAFIRAHKPESASCCGPVCCA